MGFPLGNTSLLGPCKDRNRTEFFRSLQGPIRCSLDENRATVALANLTVDRLSSIDRLGDPNVMQTRSTYVISLTSELSFGQVFKRA